MRNPGADLQSLELRTVLSLSIEAQRIMFDVLLHQNSNAEKEDYD
jgi:hypothetical protein